ncbi:regulator of telomere elongation helicase 1 homolog [Anopheles ziemanni]|uniref:regulator of telomere elongation helicase 1 homolog n=1 Tax=Anopheles coustani TaxID=139045 RepID=UPI00265B166D|nr:regulator of telomere elongation helicase 1 homolog [Anopheles coustani]XP_058175683.1 regulator of telomere elongation helicase 1 homolog [Anopheles ziemanni]
MPEYTINGIPVQFPFEPYEVQKNYMAKVIECLQNSTNGVLESPTGTGKTLSLLCSSLAWLQHVRSKSQSQSCRPEEFDMKPLELSNMKNHNLTPEQAFALMESAKVGLAKVVYASRTHSQLSQAMQELKSTSYNFFRAISLGSRDQLCIHPEVSKVDSNAMKTNLCREKVKARSCSFYSRVEKVKDHPEVNQVPIHDIEDLITVGTKMKACPFYLSKELVEKADMLFMPYNYLLDAKARKANNLSVQNSVIILDEAHNVEKMCEESGSTHIRSSDIALAIEDTSSIISTFVDAGGAAGMDTDGDGEKLEFTMDDLVLLKEMLLGIEKAVDDIPIQFSQKGSTFGGTYVFELLEKANVKFGNANVILQVLASLVAYTTSRAEKNNFVRRGAGLQAVADFLEIVFSGSGPEYQQAVERCFKVHVEQEESKNAKAGGGSGGGGADGKGTSTKRTDGWLSTKWSKKSESSTDKAAGKAGRVVNFWCFNPGFGMRQLTGASIRSIILTSGTLAPLKPLINELSIPVGVSLENPHIIGRQQVYVKIVPQGPDRVTLNSSYTNRNNPEYIASLGRTVLSFCPVIPGGLLIFFPSYPMLNKCVEEWQTSGMWAQINRAKAVFIEPRGKDAFASTMAEYYARLQEPASKGAIFMAVCRGKVSEGLDFADANGRAVMITGLPFPPLMDARVMLKKQYLEANRSRENEMISGDEWYSLEAARAVNQAIGRVIRHKDDYGAILLCDTRFQQHRQKAQLSSWVQGHLREDRGTTGAPFGSTIGELSRFFRNLEKTATPAQLRETAVKLEPASSQPTDVKPTYRSKQEAVPPAANVAFQLSDYLQQPAGRSQPPTTSTHPSGKFLSKLDCNTHSVNTWATAPEPGLITIYKRERRSSQENHQTSTDETARSKKRKLVMVPTEPIRYGQPVPAAVVKQEAEASAPSAMREAPVNRIDFLKEVKGSMDAVKYKLFLHSLAQYHREGVFVVFIANMCTCFENPSCYYLLKAMRRFVKVHQKHLFDEHLARMGL